MSSNTDHQVEPGTLLEGKYRIERELGVGGMGKVYLAQHETIERPVAIKVLHQKLASDDEVRRRFETEAKAIARLRHPNCVMLYEFGYSDDIEALFAVFEYVEGKSLEAWVGQQLPVEDVLEIGRQVARGIAHAHDQKIIHRDLKPENVMVVGEGENFEVKVLDFGIARIAEDDEKRTRLTQVGQMFGTPPYMSPEQVRAKLNVSAATDIYAIGVMLYELLEGSLPFLGETPIETVMMHLNEDVPPFERQGVPDELHAVVLQCLEKDADDRFPSCEDLEQALGNVEWSRQSSTLVTLDDAKGTGSDEEADEGAQDQALATGPTLMADPAEPGGPGESKQQTDSQAEESSIPSGDTNGDPDLSDDDGPTDETASANVTTEEGKEADASQNPQDSQRINTLIASGQNRHKILIGAALIGAIGLVSVVLLGLMMTGGDDEPLADSESVPVPHERADEQPSQVEVEELPDGEKLAVDDSEDYNSGADDGDESENGSDSDVEHGDEAAEDESAAAETTHEDTAESVSPRPRPAPQPAPEAEPETGEPSDTESDAEERAAQPDSIRLDRRRRVSEEEERADDEEDTLEEPAGIGLPARD